MNEEILESLIVSTTLESKKTFNCSPDLKYGILEENFYVEIITHRGAYIMFVIAAERRDFLDLNEVRIKLIDG